MILKIKTKGQSIYYIKTNRTRDDDNDNNK